MLAMLGGFSEEALQLFQLAASEQGYDFSEGGETYDFARCVRPDGSFYGTGGTCKKGSPAGAKEKADERSRSSEVRTRPRGAIESDIRALRQKTKGRGLEAVKANTEIKKLEAELAKPLKGGNRDKMTAAPARKPRASSSELKESQAKLFDEAKAKRAVAKEAEKAAKQVERETKGDRSPEARKRRLEAGRAWDKANTAADRAQTKWMKENERWSKASGREQRAKMSPAQRAEERRIDKIIKERG